MNKKKKENKKEYYILDRNSGLHLTPTGYFKLLNGVVLFKTKGFDEYSNEHGLITNPDYVTRSTFKYTYCFPYKYYFNEKTKYKVNTKIRILKNDDIDLRFDPIPIYVYLNWYERKKLDCRFKNLLIQKKDFWMWLTNVIVALGATIAGFLVVFG